MLQETVVPVLELFYYIVFNRLEDYEQDATECILAIQYHKVFFISFDERKIVLKWSQENFKRKENDVIIHTILWKLVCS